MITQPKKTRNFVGNKKEGQIIGSVTGSFPARMVTAPEVEVNHGYCDFFLLPDLTHYPSKHSYILELKYLPKKDFAAKAEAQWAEAVGQIKGYAVAPRVEKLRQGTTLHKIVMQFEGWELRRMEEID